MTATAPRHTPPQPTALLAPCSWVVPPHSHVRWSRFARPPAAHGSLFAVPYGRGSLDSRLRRSSSRTPFSRPRFAPRSPKRRPLVGQSPVAHRSLIRWPPAGRPPGPPRSLFEDSPRSPSPRSQARATAVAGNSETRPKEASRRANGEHSEP